MGQENNILKNCQLIAALASIIFLGFATFSSMSAYQFVKHSDSVSATITGVNSNPDTQGPHIVISYMVGGKKYEKIIYEYRTNWYEGDHIFILYDIKNPTQVRVQESLYSQSTIFGVLGSLFLIVFIIIIAYQQKVQSRQRKLIIEGNRVEATIIGCMINSKVKIYGRHPYQIEATYEDLFSKAVYHFKSHNIYHNPPNMLGLHIPVYVNPHNAKDYYMDLATLRKQLLEKGTAREVKIRNT